MIQLSEIDFAVVLKGARVPLHHSHNAPDCRVEWNVDRIINIGNTHFESIVLGVRQSVEYLAGAVDGSIAIDPTDPDVARLLDMRIAGRVADRPFSWAQLTSLNGHWTIVYGGATWNRSCGVGHVIESEPVAESKATARAALIKALYPRKA